MSWRRCIYCGFDQIITLDSRWSEKHRHVRRRHMCLSSRCKRRFTTTEEPVIRRSAAKQTLKDIRSRVNRLIASGG